MSTSEYTGPGYEQAAYLLADAKITIDAAIRGALGSNAVAVRSAIKEAIALLGQADNRMVPFASPPVAPAPSRDTEAQG